MPNPDVRAPLPEPLAVGRPLFLRLGPIFTTVLVLVFALAVALDDGKDPVPDGTVGTCVTLTADQSGVDEVVDCDADHDAIVESTVGLEEPCPAGDLRFTSDDLEQALCLRLT